MPQTKEQTKQWILNVSNRLGEPLSSKEQETIEKMPYRELCKVLRELQAHERKVRG